VNALLNRRRSLALRWRLATGRAQLGRVPTQPSTALWGPSVSVDVPARSRMTARVIRADGTIEDLGVIGESSGTVPQAYLDGLREQAGG